MGGAIKGKIPIAALRTTSNPTGKERGGGKTTVRSLVESRIIKEKEGVPIRKERK